MRIASIVGLVGMLSAAACGGGNDNEAPKALVGEGVYDAAVEHDGTSFEQMGSISIEGDRVGISLQLGPDASVGFSGRLNDDSTLHGSGTLQVTDIVYQAEGEATFRTDGDTYVVTGSAVAPDSQRGFDRRLTFTMQRPVDADASRFSGPYEFTLDPGPTCACTSTIQFHFTIDRLGYGSADDTTERASDGAVLATLAFPGITLSPEGKLRVSSGYDGPSTDMFQYLTLIGTLEVSHTTTTGSGDTFIAGFSPVGTGGTWTAVRLNETPAARARP